MREEKGSRSASRCNTRVGVVLGYWAFGMATVSASLLDNIALALIHQGIGVLIIECLQRLSSHLLPSLNLPVLCIPFILLHCRSTSTSQTPPLPQNRPTHHRPRAPGRNPPPLDPQNALNPHSSQARSPFHDGEIRLPITHPPQLYPDEHSEESIQDLRHGMLRVSPRQGGEDTVGEEERDQSGRVQEEGEYGGKGGGWGGGILVLN